MKIALITDAWQPQVNGVVTTLVELVRELELIGHQIEVIHPGQFKTRPCPGYAAIDLRSLDFSWEQSAQLFESYLVSAQNMTACKAATEGALPCHETVTSLSSNR